MKYFKLFKVFSFIIHLYAGGGFFSPSHGLCRPPLPRSLFVVVETPVTGWFEKVVRPGQRPVRYQRTMQPVRFTLSLSRDGSVPYALSFQNISEDGSLTRRQELYYDNITVMCHAELRECSCQSLEVGGLDDFDGLYDMDEPASDTAADSPDVPREAAVPGSRDEGHSPSGAGVQEDLQQRLWPTWSFRKDVRPTKPPVGSGLSNLMTNLNFDQSILARLPGGVNTNQTTYLQMTAAIFSSPGTGSSRDLGYASEGHSLSGEDKTTTKPKKALLRHSMNSLPHEPSHIKVFWSKPEMSFKQMLLDYDYVVSSLGKGHSQNTIKSLLKPNTFINTDYAPTFFKQSLEKDDASHFDDNPSERGRKHYANQDKEYGLPKPQFRQQSEARLMPQLAAAPHATRLSTDPHNAETSPADSVKGSSSPVTLIPGMNESFSDFPQLDTSFNTVHYSSSEKQVKKQYSVRLQWDDELATWVLVSGGTLVAISDKSSLCPDTSSGSWWQLTDKPRSPDNYTAHLQYISGREQDSGTAGTDRGTPGHSNERYSGGLQEPSTLDLSSEEQNYEDNFDLSATKEQDTEARLEKKLVTITCRVQRNKTLGQDWRGG